MRLAESAKVAKAQASAAKTSEAEQRREAQETLNLRVRMRAQQRREAEWDHFSGHDPMAQSDLQRALGAMAKPPEAHVHRYLAPGLTLSSANSRGVRVTTHSPWGQVQTGR